MTEPRLSIVVPAHNEEAVIGRLLGALADGRSPGDELVVVCNGCTDRTAEVARGFPDVRVEELPSGGKPAALNAGDRCVSTFPRFYVDADVVTTSDALRAVARQMGHGVEAGAPSPVIDDDRSTFLVRAYYRFWSALPYVTEANLGGSGVIGVTQEGRSRFSEFPDVICDDEYVRRLFGRDERVHETAGTSIVAAPRTLRALIDIKARGRLGLLQLDERYGPARPDIGTSGASGARHALRSPAMWFPFLVYAAVRGVATSRARRRARRRDFAGWARDETTR